MLLQYQYMNNVDVLKTPRLCFCWPSAGSQSMVGKSCMSLCSSGSLIFSTQKETDQSERHEFCAEFSWKASDFFYVKRKKIFTEINFFYFHFWVCVWYASVVSCIMCVLCFFFALPITLYFPLFVCFLVFAHILGVCVLCVCVLLFFVLFFVCICFGGTRRKPVHILWMQATVEVDTLRCVAKMKRDNRDLTLCRQQCEILICRKPSSPTATHTRTHSPSQ